PLLSKNIPLERPALSINKVSWPSISYFQILLLGWSVKNIFPFLSVAGPSVKENSFEIKTGFALSFTIAETCAFAITVWVINQHKKINFFQFLLISFYILISLSPTKIGIVSVKL